ncbi:DEAD/DEAH box helicase [Methylocapsa aurea]|uniref:DEAD/DEAH box helicase n=1 Tax=Methylocapsa aurea TaxID=663610 RepID=UPI00056BFE5F|nr:DEAD/DEAH box helicase [Methylocapsa aurea]
MQDFTGLGLAAPLLHALARQGYVTPTPIQAQAIPAIMAGRDIVGIAQTGTGKTAAFALPILHYLATHQQAAPRGGCRVLVLSPTRELASQIAESFRTLGSGLSISVAVVFGGVPHGAQIKALARGLDVLVATPGRLVDHLDSRAAQLGKTEFFVLDEVDQMLDLGFVKAIRRVVRDLPKQRQNLFFSATMPTEIAKLAGDLLNDPVQVSVTPVAKTADRVNQQVLFVETHRKRDILVELFADVEMTRAIVFTRTKRGADKVTQHLDSMGIAAVAIHGNKSQSQRERSLASFRAGRVRALVATDIAARGIDIDGVTHVVNFELPEVAEAYVHRIGRTARAGAEGIAISLCDGAERDLLRNIEKLTRLRLPALDRRADPTAVVQPARDIRAPVRLEAGARSGAQSRLPNPPGHHHAQERRGARTAATPNENSGARRERPRFGEPRRGGKDTAHPA